MQTLLDSPLLLANFDMDLQCIGLSHRWQQRLAPNTAGLSLPLLLSAKEGDKLPERADTLMKSGGFMDAVPVLMLGIKPELEDVEGCQLYCWIETHNDSPILIAIVYEPPCDSLSEELQRVRAEYELILGAAGEGIYGLDKEGRATAANAASTRILGWSAEDILGSPVHDIHHHSHADGRPYAREECPIYAALTDGEVHRVDDEVFWKDDGSCVPVEYISTPVIKDGVIEGAVIVFRDISQRKELERQREQAFNEVKQLKEELEQERDYLRDEINITTHFGDIVGESPALKHTLSQIEAVADTPTSVLILGESGVGKEAIARAIHCKSSRGEEPLVKVNCASIPKDLFESEFFGHIKGSFTGAHRDRVGRLQLANGGTLFLDEVGEIPLDLQGKLLRALQEQEFERVGDEKTTKVNVRVVAATNKNLTEEVKEGRFREDLFYRLSVFPITVPPLRERIADITPLTQHFLNLSCQELGRDPMSLSNAQINTLSNHDWPGNIRELKNVIERAVILSKGTKLRLDLALPNAAVDTYLVETNANNDTDPGKDADFLTDIQFRELEKNNMLGALRHADWKISGKEGAAALLGLKPSTLSYRMGQFDIKKEAALV